MARTNDDDMLMEDELAAAFLDNDSQEEVEQSPAQLSNSFPSEEDPEAWDEPEDFPGQLAVDVYETADKLVVKARTAGISKNDLDVTISDNILTISGILSGGEDEQTTRWHIQECYWGEFSRTIALPVSVREDEGSVKAELKDGVLTISFEKEKTETPTKITIQQSWKHCVESTASAVLFYTQDTLHFFYFKLSQLYSPLQGITIIIILMRYIIIKIKINK